MAPRGEKDKLRFFKVMVDKNYSEILYLPPMIAKKVECVIGQETEIEDTKGDRWPVSVSKVDDRLAFEEGWQKFSSDHRLKRGEVLVFKYIWGSHFVVRVFGLSARDRENFNDRPSKRPRRGAAVEEEPFQTFNIDPEDSPVLDTPDEVERTVLMNIEDIDCMMKKEDGCYQGEDRTIWGDLSKFEQGILSVPDPNTSHDVSKSQSDFSEQVGDDVQMGDVYTCQIEGHSGNDLTHKLEDHPLYTKLAPSQSDIVDKTKRHDAEIVIQTNQIKGHSGISTDKFKKAVETKTIPFDLEIKKKAIGKKDGTPTAAIHSSQTAQPENSNMRKGLPDVSNSKDGSSKIRQGVFETKIRPHEFPVSSSVGKDPGMPDVSNSKDGSSKIRQGVFETKIRPHEFPVSSSVGKDPGMPDVSNSKDGSSKIRQGVFETNIRPHEFPVSSSVGKDPGMPDVSNSKDGSSKIRQGVFETKIRPHEFPVSSSVGKDPGMPDVSNSKDGSSKIRHGAFETKIRPHEFPVSSSVGKDPGMPDVSNSKDGSSKIRHGVFETKIRPHEFPVSSSVGKDPSGKRAVKKEMMEIEDETSCFPQAFCGKEPTMVDKPGEMKVKDEPQSYDDFCSQPVAFIPFSAEVKSKLYLELPEEVSFRGRRKNKSGKIVYLRDSERRLWPLFYPEKPGVKALCLNWTNFCRGNNIKLGDKCRFQFENETPCIVQVQVIPGSGEDPHE